MALSDAEIKSAYLTARLTLSSQVGGSAADQVPVRMAGGLMGVVNDSARRCAAAQGFTPDQNTAMDFITACLMLGARAVASPSADDQVRLSRFGW
jgi:hypothetical protein